MRCECAVSVPLDFFERHRGAAPSQRQSKGVAKSAPAATRKQRPAASRTSKAAHFCLFSHHSISIACVRTHLHRMGQECPVDCELSTWTAWTGCEPYCEGPARFVCFTCWSQSQQTHLQGGTSWHFMAAFRQGSQTRQRNVTRKASFGGKSCNSLAASEPDFTGGVTKQIRQCSNLCGPTKI